MSTISGLLNSIYTPQTTSPATSSVSHTAIPGLAQTAVSLTSQEGLVASIGGAPSASETYDAAGLLNALAQAGTLNKLTSTSSSKSSSPVSADQAAVNALSLSTGNSGLYNPDGSVQGTSANTPTDWASMLKANPSLASTYVSNSANQGIIGNLSKTA